jgi:flagellar motor switch protein FliN/FliY
MRSIDLKPERQPDKVEEMNEPLDSETELNVAVSEAAAAAEASGRAPNLDAILAIPVTVQVVLGTTSMPVAKLMKLNRGAVITLDQRVGAPVSVLVNGRTVARGEVVVVDEDNSRFGVTLTEIVGSPYDSAAAR